MKITLPKNTKSLRLYHLQAIAELDIENVDIYAKAILAHKLTGLDMETIKRVSIQHVNKIINHYINMLGMVKKEKPPQVIEVKGKRYELIKSMGQQPTAWHIDIANFGTKDAAVVAAFCYIEEGLEYCQQDKHKNIINPVTPRADIFREELSADVFIKTGFFLSKKLDRYKGAYMEIRRQRQQKNPKKQKPGSGKI